MSGRLARCFLTVQEFNPVFKHLPGRANVVADAFSRNVAVGIVTEQPPVILNFAPQDLANVQCQHDVWIKVIYAWESGDETSLPKLPIPFPQFFLSQDGVLLAIEAIGLIKTDPVAQCVITETYMLVVLRLVQDEVIAGHPGKERTLSAARRKYYWPTMRVDIDAYIDKCVECAQHKGNLPKPALIVEYPPPEQPWNVVAMDLLQLLPSHQGS